MCVWEYIVLKLGLMYKTDKDRYHCSNCKRSCARCSGHKEYFYRSLGTFYNFCTYCRGRCWLCCGELRFNLFITNSNARCFFRN